MAVIKKFFRVEYRGVNHEAGVSHSERKGIITNRPELITLGDATHERPASMTDRAYAVCSWANQREREFAFDASKLEPQDFVLLVTHRSSSSSIETSHWKTYENLAGREVAEAEMDWLTALDVWYDQMKEEAYIFLIDLASRSTSKVRHSLRFASGAYRFARHVERTAAWTAVLRGLGFTGDTATIASASSYGTCEAAIALGWVPSIPKPEKWQGLPEGVVEIPL